jgi:hypothetical protein
MNDTSFVPEGLVIDLNYWVIELAQARDELERVKAAQAVVDAEIDQLIQERYGHVLNELDARRESAQADIEQCDKQVKHAAIGKFEDTGRESKKPHPAVTIRVGKEFEYDEQEAKEYCLLYLPDALKLHVPTFKKNADGLAFVTTHEKISAAIKRDLSDYV